MRKGTPVWAAFLAWAMLSEPASAAPFAEISTALAAGNGALALALAQLGLSQNGLSGADRARLLADRGIARNLQGDKDGAIADLTKALASENLTAPEQAQLYLELGLVRDSLGRLDDAVGDYGAALRLAPNSAAALNNRANIFRRQGRFEEARRDYLASLAAGNPAPEYPYYGLGEIAERQGKSEEAKNFYSRALAANPDYSLAAERLVALGEAPAAEPPIILKPPQGMDSKSALVVLHPSTAKVRAAPAGTPRMVSAQPFNQDVVLRPALDNLAGQQGPPGALGRQEAQLGAWRSEAEAQEGWKRAVEQAGEKLAGFSSHIVAVDLPGRGRFYRLRVATADARQLCAALARQDVACIQAPP